MLTFLRMSSVAGLLVFLPVLLVTVIGPHYVERAARDFAVSEVQKEVDAAKTFLLLNPKATIGDAREAYAELASKLEALSPKDEPET